LRLARSQSRDALESVQDLGNHGLLAGIEGGIRVGSGNDATEHFALLRQIPDRVLLELHQHDGCPQSGYILRGEKKGDSLDLHNLAMRVIAPTLKAVGVNWHGYYSLRRGAGTITTMVARDRGLAAKGLLRHASLSTTSEHYIDSVPSETRAAVEQVGEMFHNCSKEGLAKPAK